MSTRFRRFLGGALLALSISSFAPAAGAKGFSAPPPGWDAANRSPDQPGGGAQPVDIEPEPAPSVPVAPNPTTRPDAPVVADPIDAMSPAAAKKELARRRAVALARLRAYRQAQVYPRNRGIDGLANVFIDELGQLCAMAKLIQLSGRQDLVDYIHQTNNLIRLGTVTSGPIHAWILRSGLTLEEVALIQLPDSRWEQNQIWIQEENFRINAHLDMVYTRLKKDGSRSLTTAARRLLATRAAKTS
ncbi:MAG: hypothetical protein IT370_25915 [Deltaproteobacteria bacterium]|nr:hypothetical protein [Deltaproteobacteria bacterium]